MSIKLKSSIGAAALVLVGVLAAASPAMAQRGQGRDQRQDRRDDRRDAARDNRGYVLDNRYNHNHYYPPRGYVLNAAPRGAVIVRRGGIPYYYHGGAWYRPYGPRFVAVRPPFGLFVSVLPPFYSTLWVRGVPYYYADDAYYVYRPDRRGYEVTAPPDDADVTTSPAGSSTDVFIYPKNGQSEEQQGKDRYECHSWAAGQAGFDPTQPLGGVDKSQATTKRADYMRAMTACLEARGYSVK
jgi:hypothetical protein